MGDEERREPSQFRVVDKRISARTDPIGTPEPQPPDQPAPKAVSREAPGAPVAAGTAEPARGPAAADEEIWTPEQEAEAQRVVQEIAQRPSVEWVINTAVTLANVAGTKLDLGQVADAQPAIDALAAIVERLGPRLVQAEQPLRQTLAQLQLAYAQRAMQSPPAP
ncbi:MAG: hypothetical protein M3N53_10990 [Actinomycetota bacterium]|nr:hypothetical protein [Actinomycetota bacterium]